VDGERMRPDDHQGHQQTERVEIVSPGLRALIRDNEFPHEVTVSRKLRAARIFGISLNGWPA
jgi:hypothetical protein